MTIINNKTTVRRIYLYGAMAEKFSKEPIELAVDTVAEINLAFRSIFPGWRNHVLEAPNLAFILSDDAKTNMRPVLPEFVGMAFGEATEVHLVPEADGEWEAMVLAIGNMTLASIAVNVLVSFAVSTVLGMISQMLAPSPNTGSGNKNVARNESFIYNGAINALEQGGPVPLIYGYFMTGSTVISTAIDIEQMLIKPEKSDPPNNGGGQAQPQFPPAVAWQWAGK